ncbi:MAG: hypothetical protein H0V70_14820 [Ktedonobacteraceae bacterium]|nr:hypothetical protein [Ktedonobacteraceae bacterium]
MKKTALRQEKQARTRQRGSVQRSFVQARRVYDHLLCLESGFVTILAVEGISYDLKSPDEQLLLNEAFQQMLAGLSYPIQILWRVLPLNLNEYLDQFTFLPDQEEAEGIWPLLSSTHAAFFQHLGQRRTLLKRTIYLVIRVDGMGKPQSRAQRLFSRKRRLHWQQQLEQARQDLNLRAAELMRQLGDMNLFVKRLRGEQELVPFYYSCLTPAKADRFPLAPAVIDAIDRPIRAAYLAPGAPSLLSMEAQDKALVVLDSSSPHLPEPPRGFSQLADLVAPAAIIVQPDCLFVEKEYSRTFVVHHLPRTVSTGWLKPLADLDEPMEVIFHLEPLSSSAMIQQLRRQNRSYRSSEMMARGKGGDTDPNTKIAGDDVRDLLPRLASGEERMLTISLLVQVRGSSKRVLNERTERIQAVLHTMLLVAHEALFEQEKAFRSCLPHGVCELPGMLLDSRSGSTLFPFLSNTLFHAHGVMEGVTPQGDPVIVDPWGEGMANANRIILGPPGWGKSHGVKSTVIRQILKAVCAQRDSHQKEKLCYQVIVVDPEREYAHMSNLFGGQVIRLSPGSAHCINPFDLPRVREEDQDKAEHIDRLAEHIQHLHRLLEIMLADRTPTGAGTLKSEEKGILDRVLFEAYRKVGITKDIQTHRRAAPLMRDVYEVLQTGRYGTDITGLTQRLERFVDGSLAGLFAGPTNVSLDRVIVDFDVRDLETELRPIGLFLVSNFVWTESFHSKIPRQLIVDEAATLMDYESGAIFMEDLVRRARKDHLGVTTITQNPLTFIKSAIPANCATHILMRQDATTLDLVQQMFRLSSREVHLLSRLPTGEALLLTNEKRLHIRFEASDVEHLLATTNRSEMAQWPEQCARDPDFARLLHRLGLDEPLERGELEETYTTGELPQLESEPQLPHTPSYHHQNSEV